MINVIIENRDSDIKVRTKNKTFIFLQVQAKFTYMYTFTHTYTHMCTYIHIRNSTSLLFSRVSDVLTSDSQHVLR